MLILKSSLQVFSKRWMEISAKTSRASIRRLSTEPMIHTPEESEPQIRKPRRVRELKQFEEPFIKNLFIGKMNPAWLEYPEVLNLEEISALEGHTKRIDGITVHGTQPLTSTDLKTLTKPNLLGLKVPLKYDGLEFTETENAVMQEVLAGRNTSVAKIVSEVQDLAVKALNEFGSEIQKEKYLWAITKAEHVPCIGFLEATSLSQPTNYSTVAVASSDGQSFSLSGKKRWVYNATLADTMIVLGATVKVTEGEFEQGLTAFLVDKSSKGVNVSKPYDAIGLPGVQICDVSFDNVSIPVDDILGEVHEGERMFEMLLESSKFMIGAQCCGIMKKLINSAIYHCIQEKHFNQPKTNTEYARGTIARMTCAAYAAESMTYMLMGWFDNFNKPDMFLESMIVKIYASQALQFVIQKYIQLVGQDTFIASNTNLQAIFSDSHYFSTFEETNDQLKITLSLLGLQYAGMNIHDTVKKLRNPLQYPKYIMHRLLIVKDVFSEKQLKLGLKGFLHPSLQEQAETLEYCVSRLYYGAEGLLMHHGTDILQKHMQLKTLGDIAVYTFAIAASLARASRSYCIGLRNSDVEMTLAITNTKYLSEKIRICTKVLSDDPFSSHEVQLRTIGERIFTHKSYPLEHPITRNF